MTSPDAAAKKLKDKLTNILNKGGMYHEGMTLSELVDNNKKARKNIDNFVVDNALREHIENTYLPMERRLEKMAE